MDGVRTLGYNLFNAIDTNAPLPGTNVGSGRRMCAGSDGFAGHLSV